MTEKDIEKYALKRQALIAADQNLPSEPVISNGETVQLQSWEVVLAYNLKPPQRLSQEFFWLEVLAADKHEALETARKWAIEAPENFEVTDYLRPSEFHHKSIGFKDDGTPIPVQWNIPLEADTPDWQLIKDPISGAKVGFKADPAGQAMYAQEKSSNFLILFRRPVLNSEPICWVPIVEKVI